MKRSLIIHLSDLHFRSDLKPSADLLSVLERSIDLQLATVTEGCETILLVTGDLVESPTAKAMVAAERFFARIASKVSSCFVIPGNHDVKRWFGSFWVTKSKFMKYFVSDRTFGTHRHYHSPQGGIQIIGLDSNSGKLARGAIKRVDYDRMIGQAYESMGAGNDELPVFRFLALHHHPLPLAEDETSTVLGFNAEHLMYLQAPARFLNACMGAHVCLIMHGHRHVHGLARYSVPHERVNGGWKDIFVLSCPSSTGETESLDAGFNVVAADPDVERLVVSRFQRAFNRGVFELKDVHEIDLRPIDDAFHVGSEARLLNNTRSENDALKLVTRLFSRPAFRRAPDRGWRDLHYAISVVAEVWEHELSGRLPAERSKYVNEVGDELEAIHTFVSDQVLRLTREDKMVLSKRLRKYHEYVASIREPEPREIGRLEESLAEHLKRLQAALRGLRVEIEVFGLALKAGPNVSQVNFNIPENTTFIGAVSCLVQSARGSHEFVGFSDLELSAMVAPGEVEAENIVLAIKSLRPRTLPIVSDFCVEKNGSIYTLRTQSTEGM